MTVESLAGLPLSLELKTHFLQVGCARWSSDELVLYAPPRLEIGRCVLGRTPEATFLAFEVGPLAAQYPDEAQIFLNHSYAEFLVCAEYYLACLERLRSSRAPIEAVSCVANLRAQLSAALEPVMPPSAGFWSHAVAHLERGFI
jgi:hypothetical protein